MSAAETASLDFDLLLRLQGLLSAFLDQSREVRAALKQWNNSRPEELARVGVQHLSRTPPGAAEEYLARLLATNGAYMKHLLSTSVVTGAEAAEAARALSNADFAFFRRLVDSSDEKDRTETINRRFEIINSLQRASVVVPWLQRMTHHRDPRVQSKASLIFCGLYANPLLVKRQLGSPDPRVRANAIEALWHVNKLTCRAILEKAIGDPHHRVAVNAALGLYYLNRVAATDQMIAFAANPNPRFRAATAWAMGQTGDPAFQCYLKALAADPAETVRAAARHALSLPRCVGS
jgi:hypothetical protein